MGYLKDLKAREKALGTPIKVGVVGAGQMGSGMIAQIFQTPGMAVVAVADIIPEKARSALLASGVEQIVMAGEDLTVANQAIKSGKAVVITDGLKMPELAIDIVVEVSGVPEIAAQIAYNCIIHSKDIALMTVEADITVGPLLSSMANAGNSIYTICRGDEPVEALKLVEYAQDLGLEVIAAGKGKNNPNKPTSVPSDNEEEAQLKGMNPRMLTEFTDGTKTQLEMAALSNATGFPVEKAGMHGVECNIKDLASTLIPEVDGGILRSNVPVVEYTTGDVAPGVFVIVKSNSDVVTHELDYLKLGKGPYYLLLRPWHIASIEAPLSIAEAVINRKADFQSTSYTTEVAGRAKSIINPGEVLEGLGGNHYYGWAISAEEARDKKIVPIGLLQHSRVKKTIEPGDYVTYEDVEIDETRPLVAMRRLQDAMLERGII